MRRALASAFVIAGVVAGGCGSSPSCEDAVDHAAKVFAAADSGFAIDRPRQIAVCKEQWSAEARTCIKAATSRVAMMRCTGRGSGGSIGAFNYYMQKSRRVEAVLVLERIKRHLELRFVERAELPVGHAGPTPADSCCDQPGHKCAPDPALWRDPVWSAIELEMDAPHAFQFEYQGEATRATVRAVGDLDCDGSQVVYTLTCTAPTGVLECQLTEPTDAD